MLSMETINVIVPIFQGKKYIKNMIEQLERCASRVDGKCKVELFLVNDDMSEPIGSCSSNQIKITVLETDRNRGIHGARARGLDYCTGDYILFLDQDDKIRENYLENQYRKIGDADAVVCRLVNGKKLHYTDTFRFEKVITKDFMLSHWCPIVSPGQVLIRKEAISTVWRENILVNNGADDYFLWLCMMAEDKQFALNQDVLFQHVITGNNTSENTNLMMDSEEEMIEILKREAVFKGEDLGTLDGLRLSLRKIHVKQLDTQRYALACLNRFYRSLIDKGYVYDWLKRQRGKRIAIYGAGELGKGLYDFLKSQGLTPICFLDRNAPFILSEIPVCTMENVNLELDSILLTIPDKGLQDDLICKFGCEVLEAGELT